jgi:hypothetical protein
MDSIVEVNNTNTNTENTNKNCCTKANNFLIKHDFIIRLVFNISIFISLIIVIIIYVSKK